MEATSTALHWSRPRYVPSFQSRSVDRVFRQLFASYYWTYISGQLLKTNLDSNCQRRTQCKDVKVLDRVKYFGNFNGWSSKEPKSKNINHLCCSSINC